MSAVGFPGVFPGALTTGYLHIGAVQSQVVSVGFPGTFPATLTIGYLNIGAVQKPFAYGLIWGEQSPTNKEDRYSWTVWDNGSGSTNTIVGDANWGQLQLTNTQVAHSNVVQVGSTGINRSFAISQNKYGSTHNGSFTLKIRGSDTIFTQDAGSPSWETYTTMIIRQWAFVQLRLEGL